MAYHPRPVAPPLRPEIEHPMPWWVPLVGILWALALAVPLSMLAGCADTSALTVARQGVTAAVHVQVDGQKAWVQFDRLHQQAIIDKHEAPALQDAEFADYRKIQEKVRQAFHALTKASETSAKTFDAIDAKQAPPDQLGAAMGALYAAGLTLRDAAALVGFQVPWLDKLVGSSTWIGGAP